MEQSVPNRIRAVRRFTSFSQNGARYYATIGKETLRCWLNEIDICKDGKKIKRAQPLTAGKNRFPQDEKKYRTSQRTIPICEISKRLRAKSYSGNKSARVPKTTIRSQSEHGVESLQFYAKAGAAEAEKTEPILFGVFSGVSKTGSKEKTQNSRRDQTHTGTVTDQNGAVVPGVAVTLGSTGTTGIYTSTTTTDENGYFSFSEIAAGTYTVRFSSASFKQAVADVTVMAGKISNVSPSLEPGAASVTAMSSPTLRYEQTSLSSVEAKAEAAKEMGWATERRFEEEEKFKMTRNGSRTLREIFPNWVWTRVITKKGTLP